MNAILYPVLPFTIIIANATENHRQLITLLLTAANHPQMITLVIIKVVILLIQGIQDKTECRNSQGVNHSKDRVAYPPQMITLVIIKEVILPIQVIQDKTVSQNFQGVNHSKDILKCKIELLTLPHP